MCKCGFQLTTVFQIQWNIEYIYVIVCIVYSSVEVHSQFSYRSNNMLNGSIVRLHTTYAYSYY